MPYVSYVDLSYWLKLMYEHALAAVDAYLKATPSASRSPLGFKLFCSNSSDYSDVFICDGYRYVRASKLLMSLGYGNFSVAVQYDVFAQAMSFVSTGSSWTIASFQKSAYALNLTGFEASSLKNSPNLSILPLLAYHKICNDHYRNEKWQPFEPWTCNIDYLAPQSNMNAVSFINSSTFTGLMTSLIDLENSNLPIDYFTSVLPRAQYGDESAVAVGMDKTDALLWLNDPSDTSKGAIFNSSAYAANDTLEKQNVAGVPSNGAHKFPIRSSSTGSVLVGLKGDLTANASMKISALRSATALQKYKEIQNSNDPDFADQVLAHFGIKPKVDSRTSVFIGGDDKTLSINPQVNTNFQDGGEPEIKAIGVGDLSAGCKFTSYTYGIIIGIIS